MTDDQNKSFGNIHCSEKTRIPKRTLALIDVNSDKQLRRINRYLSMRMISYIIIQE